MNGASTNETGDLTLAFALRALKRLEHPQDVYHNAREWSTYVGVVSDAPPELVEHHAHRTRLNHDFIAGNAGLETGLSATRRHHQTSRYVFIGTTDEHQSAAANADWEYLSVEEAAAAASWILVTTSFWHRLKRRVFGGRR